METPLPAPRLPIPRLDRLRPDSRLDPAIAAALAAVAVAAALIWPGVRPLDPAGAALMVAACVPLAWRRRWPGPVMGAVVVLALPLHLLQYQHHAIAPAEVLALFSFAVQGRRVRTVLLGTAAVLGVCAVVFSLGANGRTGVEQVAAIEAFMAVVVTVQSWRLYKARMAAITERAERAERTREEEARRRVAEERLRIARDLHDLLAHSITVIGVQSGAASHLVRSDRPIDRDELGAALDGIAETCREARTELSATLQVLRQTGDNDDTGGPGPARGAGGRGVAVPPGTGGIAGLLEQVRAAGLEAVLAESGDPREAPEVGIVAYRIVQEALTNVVKHARAGAVRVTVERSDGDLRVTVADNGRGPAPDGAAPSGGTGFGIVGMGERARSVGGTVATGPGEDGGFVVAAVLPLDAADRTDAR